MKQRVAELEKECTAMRQDIERLGRSRSAGKSRFALAAKPQVCSTKDKDAAPETSKTAAAESEDKVAVVKGGAGGEGAPQLKLRKHKMKLPTC